MVAERFPTHTTDPWWRKLGEFLQDSEESLIPASDLDSIRNRWNEIQKEEDELDDRLFIGLVGGTGVGKSTLTNALAAEVISQAGDRRPTTDRAVVYRHIEEELPLDFPREDIATPERTHQIEDLRRIVIVDFPDFDSVQANHANVLKRCLPHLDLTFVVVDETKYGDKLLYETLNTFPLNSENLFFIFNKLDELQVRYGASYLDVAQDLLGDLRRKVQKFVGWEPDEKKTVALSSHDALKARLEDPEKTPEEFKNFLNILLSFREQKRRLSAKAVNLQELKSRFAQDLTDRYLKESSLKKLKTAQERLKSGYQESEAVLTGLRRGVLHNPEKRALASDRLREIRSKIGFPLDMILTFWGEWRWFRRKSEGTLPTMISDRLKGHYRPMRDSLEVHIKDFELNAPEGIETIETQWVSKLTDDIGIQADSSLVKNVDGKLDDVLKKRWLKNHLFPGLVCFIMLWALIQPPLVEILNAVEGESDSGFFSVLGSLLKSVLQGLDPFRLVGAVVLILFLYLVGAIVVSIRVTQAVDASVAQVEGGAREAFQKALETIHSRLEAALNLWERQYLLLSEILSEDELE